MKRSIVYTGVLIILMYSSATMAVDLVISEVNRPSSDYTVQYKSLAVGQLVYTDRTTITFTNVATLSGETYIKTKNDDKYNTGDSFLTFKSNLDCTVYVAHDIRITSKPTWLSAFANTGSSLIGDTTLTLYSKDFAANTTIELGGNGGGVSSSMYSVVIVPIMTTAPGVASNPLPVSGTTKVSSREAVLSWTKGTGATSHDVYLGTSNPPAFIGNQSQTTYAAGVLLNDTTYYWRIDEVNAYGTTAGTVWHFTTGISIAWSMDDNTSDSAVVASVDGYNGTFSDATGNPPTSSHHRAECREGTGSLAFDGVDDYVKIAGYKGITGMASRTCMAWIKTNGSAANMVILNWGASVSGQQWLFGIFSSGKLAVYTGGPYIQTNAAVTDGQWHHVAAVLSNDGSPIVNEIKLYIDGVLEAVTSSSGTAAINTVSGADAALGAFENAGQPSFLFPGLIDDVRVYDYALSAEEIGHVINPTYAWNPSPVDEARFTKTNTVLNWSAGEGAVWHDVYFGTSEAAVDSAQRLWGDINGDGAVDISDLAILAQQWLTDPGSVSPSADIEFNSKVDIADLAALAADWHQPHNPLFKGSQPAATFDPGVLAYGVTYYWRVDEVNSADPQSPYKGDIWSFTNTEPTIEIMPLGDSITEGHYRYYLWNLLTNAGYDNLNFVGSLNKLYNNQTVDNRDYDKDHEGHFGQTDSYIASNVYGYLQTNPADIILLHIGTNGLDPSSADVTNILNEIDRYETNYNRPITVILAKIINRSLDEDPVKRATTTTFNNNVAAMVETRIANGDDIIIVDMENGAGFVYTTSGDMYDELHPNASGYQKMANVWFSTLQTILPLP